MYSGMEQQKAEIHLDIIILEAEIAFQYANIDPSYIIIGLPIWLRRTKKAPREVFLMVQKCQPQLLSKYLPNRRKARTPSSLNLQRQR
jgi:hypothetical protein